MSQLSSSASHCGRFCLCCSLSQILRGSSKTSRWTETRGLINSPTSTTTCSPRIWAANGD